MGVVGVWSGVMGMGTGVVVGGGGQGAGVGMGVGMWDGDGDGGGGGAGRGDGRAGPNAKSEKSSATFRSLHQPQNGSTRPQTDSQI